MTTKVINFDKPKDGQKIDNFYGDVTFASITTNPPKRWRTFARQTTDPDTAPNTVDVKRTGFVGFDATLGGVEATFRRPQRYVSIRAKPYVIDEPIGQQPLGRPFVEFYSAKGGKVPNSVLMTRNYYPFFFWQQGWGTWQTIAYQSLDIGKIIFSSTYSLPHVWSLFDTLIYADTIPDFQNIQLGPPA